MQRIFLVCIRYFAPLLITSLRNVIAELLLQLSLRVGVPHLARTSSIDREELLPDQWLQMQELGRALTNTDSPSISPALTDGTLPRLK